MMYLNACPKCKAGAVRLITDWDGDYFQCLNCGYALYVKPDLGSVDSPVSELPHTRAEPDTRTEEVAA